MADFSDAEDKQLVQLALAYEATRTRIAWKAIEAAMRENQRKAGRLTAIKLKMRLKTLKNRFGASLAHFPVRYLRLAATSSTFPAEAGSTSVVTSTSMLCATNLLVEFERMLTQAASARNDRTSQDPFPPRTLAITEREAAPPMVSKQEAQSLSVEIFKTITRAEVRQGRQEENVGELLTQGVSLLVDACQLTRDDVFVDIGSGVGNVVAQVALESCAKLIIGVEIRISVALRGQELIRQWASKYPRLQQIHIIQGDITKPITAGDSMLKGATILYCHNTLFRTSAQHDIERLCCSLKKLQVVVVQTAFCPRHTPRCTKLFCSLFIHRETVVWPVSFTSKGASFVIYDRYDVLP